MRDRARFVLFNSILVGFALIFGGALGIGLAVTRNTVNTEDFKELVPALPTKLLDVNGELITELVSEERREMIKFKQLPKHLVDALIIREDRIFYRHKGFSLKAIGRAIIGQVTDSGAGGGSTLTQQIAGTLYADRRDRTYKRKLRELWWAIQMERRYSKEEILEIYLNRIYFGAGTYGVNAASKYYFGHDIEELSPAESAILVVQLSNPGRFNPFDYPARAQDRQRFVLDEMVNHDYLTAEAADSSFEDFWANFDYTRINSASYFLATDRAPWFSEYIRRELGTLIYGSQDIYSSGFTVNTTLNLKHQAAAKDTMDYYIDYANRVYRASNGSNTGPTVTFWTPIAETLALIFDMPGVKLSHERRNSQVVSTYIERINPVLDVIAMLNGMETLKVDQVRTANAKGNESTERSKVEGTLIAIENDTGAITALIGGSEYTATNQFIRATQARIQPGSTFKPLYYSAAIDSKRITTVSKLDDSPRVFFDAYDRPYTPENYGGAWHGQVQTWYALALSLNIPSLEVLEEAGYDNAIERSVALLGIPRDELPGRAFDRVPALGLGVCSVRPVEMARAFAIFVNGGREITPHGIRTIEDRNGRLVMNVERDIRAAIQAKGDDAQIISPQNAFIMTNLLQTGAQMGTLSSGARNGRIFTYRDSAGRSYTLPAAGKTGTTQDWGDAWVVASSPYLTAAIWFGFDRKGYSLGSSLPGATLAGGAWGRFMYPANEDYPPKNFPPVPRGVVSATVCSLSGLQLSPECGSDRTTQWFLADTVPEEHCTLHRERLAALAELKIKLGQGGAITEEISGGGGLSTDYDWLDALLNTPDWEPEPEPMADDLTDPSRENPLPEDLPIMDTSVYFQEKKLEDEE